MPKRTTQITMTKNGFEEDIDSIAQICRDRKNFNIHTLQKLKFPFEYRGYMFKKEKIERAVRHQTIWSKEETDYLNLLVESSDKVRYKLIQKELEKQFPNGRTPDSVKLKYHNQ